jgi:magnesium-transporting ATPase (P-type)
MIEIAAILSAVVRHWEDFIIIFFMLALNAVVGFWEGFKAGNEIEALKKISRCIHECCATANGVISRQRQRPW